MNAVSTGSIVYKCRTRFNRLRSVPRMNRDKLSIAAKKLTKKDRQTNKGTDRQAMTDRKTETQKDRNTERKKHRQTS